MKRSIYSVVFVVLSMFLLGCSSNSIEVSFISEDGLVSQVSLDKGDLVSFPVVDKEGYSLDGWYTSLDEGETLEDKWDKDVDVLTKDLVLYAKWEINSYSIRFDSNGGSDVDAITKNYDLLVYEPEEPIKDGYTFVGWYSDELLTEPFVFTGVFNDEDITEGYAFTKMPAADTMLYAKWVVSDILFGGSDDESYNDVLVDSDGYIISVGYTWSSDGDIVNGKYGLGDALITKHDLDGNLIWYKTIGGSSSDVFSSVIQDSDGNYIVIGASNSNDGDFLNKNYGGNDAIMVKFSSDGEVLWIHHYGGSEADHFYDIAEDSDGNYIVVGRTFSFDHDIIYGINDLVDALVMKIDSDGDIVWYKTFVDCLSINSVVIDEYDGIFIVGYNDNDTRDGYFAKLDSQGSFVFVETFDLESDEIFSDLTLLADGNLVATGALITKVDYLEYFEGLVVKFDSTGEVIWHQSIGGDAVTFIFSVTSDSEGNIVGVGYKSEDTMDESGDSGFDGWIVKINLSGEIVSNMYIGGTKDDGLLSVVTTEEYIIVVGGSFSDDLNSLDEYFDSADAWIRVVVE